jgi:hypothetical protein
MSTNLYDKNSPEKTNQSSNDLIHVMSKSKNKFLDNKKQPKS